MTDTFVNEARTWLRTTTSGVLCTLAADPRIEGAPFGSIVPYALDAKLRPVVLLARIAAHTHNVQRDPRTSLFVHQPGMEGDPQTGWRLTLTGTLSRVADDAPDVDTLWRDYLVRVPAAESYRATHGFDLWRLDVTLVRAIGGFGKIAWIDGASLLLP